MKESKPKAATPKDGREKDVMTCQHCGAEFDIPRPTPGTVRCEGCGLILVPFPASPKPKAAPAEGEPVETCPSCLQCHFIAAYHDDDGTPYCTGCDAGMILGSEQPHGKDCVVAAAVKEAYQRGVAVGRAEIWTRFQEIAAFSATACGDLAERVALDMDHANKDHARWYRAVKRVRKAIAAAGKPHNSRALPLTDAPKGGSDGE
jgi:hypothetical protein